MQDKEKALRFVSDGFRLDGKGVESRHCLLFCFTRPRNRIELIARWKSSRAGSVHRNQFRAGHVEFDDVTRVKKMDSPENTGGTIDFHHNGGDSPIVSANFASIRRRLFIRVGCPENTGLKLKVFCGRKEKSEISEVMEAIEKMFAGFFFVLQPYSK